MGKLNGSDIFTGFQPILCSHYAACAQETDQNIIDKNAAILRLQIEFLSKYRRFQKQCKRVINYILVSITWHHLNDDITDSNLLLIYLKSL